MSKQKPLPCQPLVISDDVLRFRANKVVRKLLDESQKRGYGLNELRRDDEDLPDEDWQQFAQLIGYSVSGYQGLSYVDGRAAARVDKLKVPGQEMIKRTPQSASKDDDDPLPWGFRRTMRAIIFGK